MHKSVVTFLALSAGTVAATVGVSTEMSPIGGLLALAICGSAAILRPKHTLVIVAVSAAVAIGLLRATIARSTFADTSGEGRTVTISGVVREVRSSSFTTVLTVAVRDCLDTETREVCAIRGIRRLRVETPVMATDVPNGIRTTCRLRRIAESSDAPGIWAYRAAARGVLYTCRTKTVEPWTPRLFPDRIAGVLQTFRQFGESAIARYVSAPSGALSAGLIFGGDDRLSREWQSAFSGAGLTHIVAVSGYNVAVIAHAVLVLAVAMGLYRTQAIVVAIAAIAAFVVMIGAPSSAVRAAIMGVVTLGVVYGGRSHGAWNALALAAATMVMIQPFRGLYDIGFQLSVAATAGIIGLVPLWGVIGYAPRVLRELVAVTMSAQISVAPLIAYHFGVISPWALISNLVVLPMIPAAMALSVLVVFCAWVASPVAAVLGSVTALILGWVFFVVRHTAETVSVSPPLWSVVGCYAAAFACILWMIHRRRRCIHHHKSK